MDIPDNYEIDPFHINSLDVFKFVIQRITRKLKILREDLRTISLHPDIICAALTLDRVIADLHEQERDLSRLQERCHLYRLEEDGETLPPSFWEEIRAFKEHEIAKREQESLDIQEEAMNARIARKIRKKGGLPRELKISKRK